MIDLKEQVLFVLYGHSEGLTPGQVKGQLNDTSPSRQDIVDTLEALIAEGKVEKPWFNNYRAV